MKSKKGKPHIAAPRNKYGKRIIITKVIGDREFQYHATKGWRSYRSLAKTYVP